jgi:uncharacterized protein (TIGR02285 family)
MGKSLGLFWQNDLHQEVGKMQTWPKILLSMLVFIIFSVTTAPAESEKTVTWAILDWPPIHILEGEHKGEGIFDAIMDLLKRELPEYTHRELVANPPRFWGYIKKGDNFCHAASVVTEERLKHAYFSIPISFGPSNSIIMKKETAESLGLSGSVSLATLLNTPGLTGGIKPDRSYGKIVDSILAENRTEANIYEQRSSDYGLSLFQMLLYGRLDYIIEVPVMAAYNEVILNKQRKSVSLEIEENDPFIFGCVACPKNEWGRNMIDRINEIIKTFRPTKEYRAIMEMWQTEEGIERVRKGYDTVFMQKKK